MSEGFLAETCKQIVREQLPNLFRLYVNPHVTLACYCLERYAQAVSPRTPGPSPGEREEERFQTFLANSFDEALSGAIKLARFCARLDGRQATGLLFDPGDRLGPFVSAPVAGGRVEFLPGLIAVGRKDDVDAAIQAAPAIGFVVLLPGVAEENAAKIGALVRDQKALVIACLDRPSLSRQSAICNRQSAIDIVVFDESFVRHEVPFGAFSARRSLYDHWNTSGKSTFHSTTFQPNTIASLHFMRCLKADDPELYALLEGELRQIEADLERRKALFRRLYSPSLANAIAATGFETANVRAAGDIVTVDGREIFDGISGVACSVRGHNPPSYPAEMAALADVDCESELARRLHGLTGLDHMLPAVSGASAIETALKLGLVAQHPRRHVLALKSGFGGKTLFALTGTWNASYKVHIDPLYPHVVYVDPFAPDAIEQIDRALATLEIALAQAELVQGVGGVRQVPEAVIRHLAAQREQHGYLLLIDEVQTGMYRTGAFTRSQSIGIAPDLLVVGKAVSDMMFPFALVMYSKDVQAKLQQARSDLPAAFRKRHGYEQGYKTALNALRFAENARLAERVAEAGALVQRLLADELAGCKAVVDVRVFGLLVGIELDAAHWPQAWFKKKLFWFYMTGMLQQREFPVLVGFCQYEPNVLKITPPLTVEPETIRKMCATIGAVLRRPFYQLLPAALSGFLRSFAPWRNNHDHAQRSAHAPVAR